MPQAGVARTKFECANPILNVADMTRSVQYYVDVLGFINAEWGGDEFTCVTRDGAGIYLCEGDQGQPGTWVWIGVDDVAAGRVRATAERPTPGGRARRHDETLVVSSPAEGRAAGFARGVGSVAPVADSDARR